MSTETQLMLLAQELAGREGARRTAGRLFNIAALLLAETGVSDLELHARLRLAFLSFDIDDVHGARH